MCLSVCLFSTEIQTTGRIWMKFGMEVVFECGKVLGEVGGGTARYPRPQCRVTQSSIVYSEEDKIYLNYTHRQLGR